MDRVLGILSIARKAGFLEPGEEPVGAAARAKKARIILLASDAGATTAYRAEGFASAAGCPLARLEADREAVGGAVGKALCAVCAVTDMGLAAALAERLAEQSPGLAETAAEMKDKAQRMQARKKKKRG